MDLNSHSNTRQKLFIWQEARVEPSACILPVMENDITPLPALPHILTQSNLRFVITGSIDIAQFN